MLPGKITMQLAEGKSPGIRLKLREGDLGGETEGAGLGLRRGWGEDGVGLGGPTFKVIWW